MRRALSTVLEIITARMAQCEGQFLDRLQFNLARMGVKSGLGCRTRCVQLPAVIYSERWIVSLIQDSVRIRQGAVSWPNLRRWASEVRRKPELLQALLATKLSPHAVFSLLPPKQESPKLKPSAGDLVRVIQDFCTLCPPPRLARAPRPFCFIRELVDKMLEPDQLNRVSHTKRMRCSFDSFDCQLKQQDDQQYQPEIYDH
jgi:hypothetical protein